MPPLDERFRGKSAVVLDTSCLSCFARADRLHILPVLLADRPLVVTKAVLDELENGSVHHPELSDVKAAAGLIEVPVDSLEELRYFAEYARLIGSGKRDVGEASTLAWAEANGGIAIVDDQTAVNAAQARKVTVRRTLGLIAEGVRNKAISQEGAAELTDALIEGGARFPCDGESFVLWARSNSLLPSVVD